MVVSMLPVLAAETPSKTPMVVMSSSWKISVNVCDAQAAQVTLKPEPSRTQHENSRALLTYCRQSRFSSAVPAL